MKNYVKYVSLFIILIFIGAIGIHLYSKNTLKSNSQRMDQKETIKEDQSLEEDTEEIEVKENPPLSINTAPNKETESSNSSSQATTNVSTTTNNQENSKQSTSNTNSISNNNSSSSSETNVIDITNSNVITVTLEENNNTTMKSENSTDTIVLEIDN